MILKPLKFDFMKKLIFCLFFLGTALAVVYPGFSAADDSLYSVYVRKSLENKKLIVSLDNMEANEVKFTIFNPNGAVIHKDRINTKYEATKKYDLSQLDPGVYTIVVDDLMKAWHLNEGRVLSTSEDNFTYLMSDSKVEKQEKIT